MSDAPLIPGALYGLRTWRLAADDDGELLVPAAHRDRPWPDGGEWLRARCGQGRPHDAPDGACTCGIHAWHPTRAAARRVLAGRFEVAGVVEAAGAIELHEDGFRAERARPYALVLTPGRNAGRIGRLAARYRAQIVEVAGADALLAWCRERRLGLDPGVVGDLLGPELRADRRRLRRGATRRDAVRAAALAGIIAGTLGMGAWLTSEPPGNEGVFGRAGWVKRPAAQPHATPRHPAAAAVRRDVAPRR